MRNGFVGKIRKVEEKRKRRFLLLFPKEEIIRKIHEVKPYHFAFASKENFSVRHKSHGYELMIF